VVVGVTMADWAATTGESTGGVDSIAATAGSWGTGVGVGS